jgi:hypothetical protein
MQEDASHRGWRLVLLDPRIDTHPARTGRTGRTGSTLVAGRGEETRRAATVAV